MSEASSMPSSGVPLQSVWARYGCALALTFAATSVGLTVTGPLGLRGVGLFVFPLAVLASAWLGGMGAGILTAVTTAVAVAFFFLKPVGLFSVDAPQERIALAVFVMASIVESTVIGTSRRSERRLSRLTDAVGASEAKYRILFERNPEPIWIFDVKTGVIFAANDAALETYGYDADQAQRMRIDALLDPESARDFRPSTDGQPELQRHRTRSGQLLEVEIRCASAPWVGGDVCVMVVRDVTAHRRAERALETANDELRRARDVAERATEARDRFLLVLSHELRTPLTPVLLACTALEKRSSAPDETRALLALIRTKVKLEAQLIDDLLDVVQILGGSFTIPTGPADATEAVQRAVDGCLAAASTRGVYMRQEVVATTPRLVPVDTARLRQAVTNLISSAVSAAHAGSTIGVWMHDEPNGDIAIDVRYRSSRSVDLSRIFDPFDGGADPGEPFGWALRLGRAISKGIAEACGGHVEASQVGEATRVVMRLPAAGC
jgi:two-component system CheB/CheR fusion protein